MVARPARHLTTRGRRGTLGAGRDGSAGFTRVTPGGSDGSSCEVVWLSAWHAPGRAELRIAFRLMELPRARERLLERDDDVVVAAAGLASSVRRTLPKGVLGASAARRTRASRPRAAASLADSGRGEELSLKVIRFAESASRSCRHIDCGGAAARRGRRAGVSKAAAPPAAPTAISAIGSSACARLLPLAGLPRERRAQRALATRRRVAARPAAHRQPAERAALSLLQRDPPAQPGLLDARGCAAPRTRGWTCPRRRRDTSCAAARLGSVRFAFGGGALEAEHHRRVLQAANLARAAAWRSTSSCVRLTSCAPMDAPLRALLMGAPLAARGAEGDAPCAALDAHVSAVRALLQTTHGAAPRRARPAEELAQVAALPDGAGGVACRRALLLLRARPRAFEVAAHFAAGGADADAAYARDLAERVLPFLDAPRLAHQRWAPPDAHARARSRHRQLVLAEMAAPPPGQLRRARLLCEAGRSRGQ